MLNKIRTTQPTYLHKNVVDQKVLKLVYNDKVTCLFARLTSFVVQLQSRRTVRSVDTPILTPILTLQCGVPLFQLLIPLVVGRRIVWCTFMAFEVDYLLQYLQQVLWKFDVSQTTYLLGLNTIPRKLRDRSVNVHLHNNK